VTISSYNNKKLNLALGKGMNKIPQGTDEALMKVCGNGEWGIGRCIG
jgi:hypothetical protein